MASEQDVLDPSARDFYCRSLEILTAAGVPFLLGGAYAFACYTGIVRHTKDLDVFVRERDAGRALGAFTDAGYRTEQTHPHWLGKAFWGEYFVDLIFSSGNGCAPVDDEWFEHAIPGTVFGFAVLLCPAEEMIWQKAFVQERERYDGADVAHLLRCRAPDLDWSRLLRRFGRDWRVLLSQLVLFGYVYPGERWQIPRDVMTELLGRLGAELEQPPVVENLCRGPLLSRAQYLVDVEQWGYRDARLGPQGRMTTEETRRWTDAIGDENEARVARPRVAVDASAEPSARQPGTNPYECCARPAATPSDRTPDPTGCGRARRSEPDEWRPSITRRVR